LVVEVKMAAAEIKLVNHGDCMSVADGCFGGRA
jgi:hypothetical protein